MLCKHDVRVLSPLASKSYGWSHIDVCLLRLFVLAAFFILLVVS